MNEVPTIHTVIGWIFVAALAGSLFVLAIRVNNLEAQLIYVQQRLCTELFDCTLNGEPYNPGGAQ